MIFMLDVLWKNMYHIGRGQFHGKVSYFKLLINIRFRKI
jgi:hypothetical protein